MHKRNISGNAAAMYQQAHSTSDNEESKNDDGNDCDVDDSVFLPKDIFERDEGKSDGKEEIDVMGPDYKWDMWQAI
eukprot:9723347-Ditylum_brightwellii.AAC.1